MTKAEEMRKMAESKYDITKILNGIYKAIEKASGCGLCSTTTSVSFTIYDRIVENLVAAGFTVIPLSAEAQMQHFVVRW